METAELLRVFPWEGPRQMEMMRGKVYNLGS